MFKKILWRRSAAVGDPHHPLTHRTPPSSEKNGSEPPFLDNFGRFGVRPALKSSCFAGLNKPTVESGVDALRRADARLLSDQRYNIEHKNGLIWRSGAAKLVVLIPGDWNRGCKSRRSE